VGLELIYCDTKMFVCGIVISRLVASSPPLKESVTDQGLCERNSLP
jgi:hypothetical protein